MTAREDYQELMEKRLNDWKAKTKQFKTNIDKAGTGMKAAAEHMTAQFRKYVSGFPGAA